MSDTPDRALEVLGEILDAPADQRAAVLERDCAGDTTLRAEVERLLEIGLGQKANEILAAFELQCTPGPGPAGTDSRHSGRYRVLRLIGEGGMGSVYEAEQDYPRRRVAMKVIKAGMDSRQVIRRFEAERDALALMDHPNIARVFDAGVGNGGRPFFVMELVEGAPLTTYCDSAALPVRQRLDLFIAVCAAVQHAHQRAIIHRDLKPSNVLVGTTDGRPVPKVIDFGIAKAVGGQLTGHTLVTECSQLIGTPEYMSPEQAAAGRDIDTRSDIYSLGVLLYELLTGTTPFDRNLLRESSADDVRRLIREVEPARPSARLASGQADPAAARARRTELPALARTVRGELDWIVMKCLEKDRARRYETVRELAADVDRYLRNEPVHAGPPSNVYRVRKFVRRNRVPLAAATVIAALTVAGIAGSTVGLLRATREARQVAVLNEFLLDMFRTAQPDDAGGGRHVTAAQLLDRAVGDLPRKLSNQPEAEVQARRVIGKAFGLLGYRDRAVENLTMAYGLSRTVFGEEAETTIDIGANLAHWTLAEPATPGELNEGYELAVRIRDAAERRLGETSPITHLAGAQVGYALQLKGDHAGAERVFQRNLDVQRRHPAAAAIVGRSNAHYFLGWAQWAQQKWAEAEKNEREALRLQAEEGNSPRDKVVALRVLAFVMRDQNRLGEAADTLREALAYEEKLGHRFPTIERVSRDYLDVLVRLKEYDKAVAFAEGRVRLAEADDPPDQALVAPRAARVAELRALAGGQREPGKPSE